MTIEISTNYNNDTRYGIGHILTTCALQYENPDEVVENFDLICRSMLLGLKDDDFDSNVAMGMIYNTAMKFCLACAARFTYETMTIVGEPRPNSKHEYKIPQWRVENIIERLEEIIEPYIAKLEALQSTKLYKPAPKSIRNEWDADTQKEMYLSSGKDVWLGLASKHCN